MAVDITKWPFPVTPVLLDSTMIMECEYHWIKNISV